MADPVEDVAGRLYGLPLDEFTRERDAAARELRRAKERDAADAVKQLPKPSQAAWVANTLAREQRALVDALLEAGDAMREAQDAAVAGKGAAALRDAAAAERAAVDALVTAAKELRPAGRVPTATTLDRLRTTLHAVASDDDVRTALDRGRLVEDAAGGSAWGLLTGGDVADAEPTKKSKPAPKRRAKPKSKAAQSDEEREASEREAREAAERETAEREAREKLEAELREARAERRSRERELDRAERAADRAAKRLEDALAAAEEAGEQAEEANAELEGAREAAGDSRDIVARLEEQLDCRRGLSLYDMASASTAGSRSPSGSSIAIRRASCARPRTSSLR